MQSVDLRCLSPAPASQIPTIGFLYVAGYIGYVGRQYLITTKAAGKAQDKEIIIDVPLATKLAWQGAGWPVAAVQVRGTSSRWLRARTCASKRHVGITGRRSCRYTVGSLLDHLLNQP